MQSAVISPQKKWPRSSYHAVTIIPYWMWATWLLRVARGRPWLPSCVQTGLRTPAIGTTRPWHFHFFLHSKYKKSPHTSTFGWLHPVLLIWYVPTLMGDAIRLLWHSCWMTTRPRECVLHSLRFSEKMLVPGGQVAILTKNTQVALMKHPFSSWEIFNAYICSILL